MNSPTLSDSTSPMPKHSLWSFIASIIIGILMSGLLFSIYLISKYYQPGSLDTFEISSIDLPKSDLINLQILQVLGLFIIPPFVYTIFRRFNFYFLYALAYLPNFILLMLAILFLVSAWPFLVYLEQVMHWVPLPEGLMLKFKAIEMAHKASMETFLHIRSISELGLMLFVMGILAGLSEELFFRGFLLKFLTYYLPSHHYAIFIQGVVFGVFHMNFYHMLPISLIGISLGYIVYRTNNLWITIAAHAVYNMSQVVMYYLYEQRYIDINIDDNSQVSWPIGLISLLVCAVVFRWLWARSGPVDELK